MPIKQISHVAIRLYGRIWRMLRVAAYIPVFYFLWHDNSTWTALSLALVLILGWNASFRLRSQEIEKPFYQLWLCFVEGLLAFSVMTCIFIRDLRLGDPPERMLAVGCVLLLARVVSHTLYSLSVLREGKKGRPTSFWSKAAQMSITVTMMIYVLNLEHFQQIAMGICILFMFASGSAFLYWYYRDPDHRKPLSIASQLTMSRIVLTPVFLWVFFYDNDLVYQNNSIIFKSLALLMVVSFMVTDFLDGYLARKMGEVSTLGKYLDPFSDKISNMTIFLCFLASDYASVWMVALIYFRESSVETLRTLAASQGLVMPARTSGKWKTAIQGIGILIILVGALDPVQANIPNWSAIWAYLPTTVMGFITLVTLGSGVDYFVSSKHVLKTYV
jgi:CDP-diacylglycerol--glycerol-3-phosphate 3-phosphatidyltransferase